MNFNIFAKISDWIIVVKGHFVTSLSVIRENEEHLEKEDVEQ